MTTETKIGIGIVHCQSTPGSTDIGFTSVYKSDYGKWSTIIDDTGAVFRYVKIDYETILRMIHFSKDGEGWYMCSMKPIPGRDEEYRASWVYFPSSLDLSKKEIKNVIEVAESQIKQKEFDSNKLQEVIQSYSKFIEDSPLYNVPSVQRGFAFRDTSNRRGYTLSDLYECIYQKEFTQYEWVLLMDKSQLTFKGDSIVDITDKEILRSYIIKPKTNEYGFIPYHNGVEFRSPVRIMEGESLAIEFKKKGYVDIPKTIKSQSDFSISINDCKKYFKKSQFVALDAKNKNRISHATIKPINASEDKTGMYWIFAEQNLEIAKFYVMADGYTADSFSLDLKDKSLYDEIPMYIEPESHEYSFILPLDRSVVKDHDSIEVRIHSQFVISESPIKGYRCSGTPHEGGVPNRLTAVQSTVEDNSSKNKREKNVGEVGNNSTKCKHGDKHTNPKPNPPHESGNHVKIIIYVFLVFLFLGLLYCLFMNDKPKKKTSLPEPESGDTEMIDDSHEEQIEQNDDKWVKAYDYLKRHPDNIHKDSIEQFEEIKDLYDIINGFQLEKYKNYIDNHRYGKKILEIDCWKKIYDLANSIKKDLGGTYITKPDDRLITFTLYIRAVNNRVSRTHTSGMVGVEGDKGEHDDKIDQESDQQADYNR